MQDVVTTIVGVTPKTTRNQGQSYWEVNLATGQKATTFEAAVGQKSIQNFNIPNVTVRLSQNGKYTNIEDVAGPGEQLPPLALPAGTPIQQPQVGFQQQPVIQGPMQAIGIDPQQQQRDRVNERIAKQEAQRTAAITVAALFQGAGPEALEQAEELASEYAKRLYRAAAAASAEPQPPAQTQIQPTAETPAQVVEQVNAEAGAAVVQQGVPSDW